MVSSSVDHELESVAPVAATVTAETLTVELEDGRTIIVPTSWYPRLSYGKPKEWKNVELSAFGIHWPDLDEDLSVRGLLLGRKSGENPESIQFWLENRKKGKRVTVMDWLATRKETKTRKRK